MWNERAVQVEEAGEMRLWLPCPVHVHRLPRGVPELYTVRVLGTAAVERAGSEA
jgi:hypothetical protein